MEFEAFGKTFSFGGKKEAPEQEQKTPEELAAEIENFEFVADIATVNAIPSDITRKYRVQGVLKRQGITLGVIILGFSLLWGGTTALLAVQAGKVSELNQERDLLQQESDALSPYQEYKQALDNKRSVLSDNTTTDINYGEIYSILTTTAAANSVDLRSIGINQFAEEGDLGGCISPDPLNQTTGIIGCVTLAASTPSEAMLISFLRGLETNTTVPEGFMLPSVSSFASSNDGGGETAGPTATVNMTIFFTYQFYSNKYEDLQLPLEELIAAGMPTDSEAGTEPAPEMTFEDKMTTIAFQVSDELAIENSIDNLEMLTNIATEMCETGELAETQSMADMLAELIGSPAEDISTAIREKC